ncbi:unnamed protein product [Prorocentrum cordatum]|uniref:Uncharacterized protein n=1 Tax=Prorocentrum cordatum TaxID=2364126 RepID=A0ABN9V1G1_9DINO|nr:unnamed protein product [Polarella glacialis]
MLVSVRSELAQAESRIVTEHHKAGVAEASSNQLTTALRNAEKALEAKSSDLAAANQREAVSRTEVIEARRAKATADSEMNEAKVALMMARRSGAAGRGPTGVSQDTLRVNDVVDYVGSVSEFSGLAGVIVKEVSPQTNTVGDERYWTLRGREQLRGSPASDRAPSVSSADLDRSLFYACMAAAYIACPSNGEAIAALSLDLSTNDSFRTDCGTELINSDRKSICDMMTQSGFRSLDDVRMINDHAIQELKDPVKDFRKLMQDTVKNPAATVPARKEAEACLNRADNVSSWRQVFFYIIDAAVWTGRWSRAVELLEDFVEMGMSPCPKTGCTPSSSRGRQRHGSSYRRRPLSQLKQAARPALLLRAPVLRGSVAKAALADGCRWSGSRAPLRRARGGPHAGGQSLPDSGRSVSLWGLCQIPFSRSGRRERPEAHGCSCASRDSFGADASVGITVAAFAQHNRVGERADRFAVCSWCTP